MHLYRKKLEYWLKTLKPDIVISTLGRELDFLTQLDDGSVKIGESHIAKPYTRNLHLMEQRGFPYKQIARHWKKKQEEAVKKLDALVVLTQHVNPEKPDVPLNKNDAFQKVQKRHVQEKR